MRVKYGNLLISLKSNNGFFSTCTVILHKIIKHYNERGQFPYLDLTKEWGKYKDSEFVDISKFFFKQYPQTKSFDKLFITYSPEEEQFSDYSLLNFKDLNFVIKKYFEPSKRVKKLKSKLILKYNIDLDNTISVLYRGNDKSKETIIPTHDEMITKIKDLRAQFPTMKLLIQSDELEFYSRIQKEFNDVIFFPEVHKIKHDSNKQAAFELDKGDRVQQAVLFLSILILLSQSKKVILNSGNVGLWLCLFRGSVSGIHQYLNPKEYIYGVKQNYIEREEKWINH